ncbi:MAG: hypothetical protein P1U68_04585 [Verrucomicrobiales bacterium]|nr:hypothetical protein [Verrucomicrobiales bacterium]
MDDVPWLYVAMIFIAFVSWVSNRIKEAAEYRRARKIEKEKAARARRTTAPPEFQSPYRKQSPPTPSAPEAEPPKSFREVFKELERQFAKPAEETFRDKRPTPPPLPQTPEEPTIKQPQLPSGPLRVSPPMKMVKRRGRRTSDSLIKTLQHGDKLKTALLLKEILDKPKALRRR